MLAPRKGKFLSIAFLLAAMCQVMGAAHDQNASQLSREIGIFLLDPSILRCYKEAAERNVSALADGLPLELAMEDGLILVTLPTAPPGRPGSFEIVRVPAKMEKLAPAPSPAIRFKDGAKSVRIHVSLFDNIIYFPAKVNGAAELDFVLDTGASGVSALDQGVVEAKGLPRGRGTTGGGAGPERVQMWELEGTTLSLPGMEMTGFRFITIPLKRMEPYWGRKKDGLLGGNILGRLVTRIDYDGRTVTFYDPGSFEAPGNGQIVPLTVEANTLFVTAQVKVEGSDVPMEGVFLLDTGVRMTFFNTPFTEKNRLIQKCPRTLENIAGFGVGGASWATMGRLASLQIGDFVVERPVVQFNTATRGIEASGQFDGIIGADILSRFIVTLDYQNQRMMLRKGARFEQPFEYDMSGLYFVTAGGRNDVFKVENVIKDSPAAKAGVEKGDILVSVDNKPASSFTLETLKRRLREAGRVVALQVTRARKTMDFSFSLERLI